MARLSLKRRNYEHKSEVKLLIQNLVAKKLQVFSHCFHKPGDKLKSRIGISCNSNCLLFLLQENKRINTRFLEVISNFLKILKSKVKFCGIYRRSMVIFLIWEITLLKSVTVLADKYMFATTERFTGFQKNITSVIFLSTLNHHHILLSWYTFVYQKYLLRCQHKTHKT